MLATLKQYSTSTNKISVKIHKYFKVRVKFATGKQCLSNLVGEVADGGV